MSKKYHIVEIKETYTVRVAIKAEDEQDAYETAETLVNDDVINPSELALDAGDYSRNCEVIRCLDKGEALPEGMKVFEWKVEEKRYGV